MYRDFPIPSGPIALGAGGAAAAGGLSVFGVDVPLAAIVAVGLAVIGGLTALTRQLSARRY